MNTGNLRKELKEKIIERLNLEDMAPEEMGDNEALFGDKIGLDSIDALELIVLLEKDYGIKITNPEQGKEIFQSVATIVDFIQKNRNA